VPEPVGIGGVVAALSVTSDLTRGHPPGEAMRACLIATELAGRAGLDDGDRTVVYYATLLRYAGCAATSHEYAAALGGDDVFVRAHGDLIDPSRPGEAMRFLASLGRGAGRMRIVARAPGMARFMTEQMRADCEVGAQITRRLRLPDAVREAVLDGFERFDGRGAPLGKPGPEIAEAARFAAVGFAAAMFDAVGGGDLAADTAKRWSGRALDPAIAAIFLEAPAELLALSRAEDAYAAVVEAEPGPRRAFKDQAALDDALASFGDAADLKTPWLHGHSGGVARLARGATKALGSADPQLVHSAGLVHDLGRVAVPTGVWERAGALTADEWELVRLHPYHSGRILARAPALAPLGRVASRHHERTDGTGYPAGIGAPGLDPAAAVLAAADVMHALGEPRPHRPALEPAAASRVLAGLPLDRDAIKAVLDAAGAPPPALPPLPADLTERELEVMRRLVAGRTKRQIASELVISPSTVHTHTVHIYGKCGVSTRAGLAMFAMRHGLAGAPKID
jgi:HD-GYP domain-containing protein (c-di-GMP phosphodiesterase class II)/DNA-binding CsgD family transcriptional regulator